MARSNGEDVLWVSRMLGHKSSDITLRTYAKAYRVNEDKTQRPRRAQFLEKGHSMGTVNNIGYSKSKEIGV